ncbi:MAG TPA: hypothetical protein VK607_10185 [Kofleriaceae bacterium]|nr:hypothetical protein [Kofleriaceae bacterium]
MQRQALNLNDVTMMEAVHALRENHVYLQFEREPLTDANTDRSRPVVDSKRRFSAVLDVARGSDQIAATLIHADQTYDAIQLTSAPDSFFIFPRAAQGADRLSRSALSRGAPRVETVERPLNDVVRDLLSGADDIALFDRAGFLRSVTSVRRMDTDGVPLYSVLGELFARSDKALVWDASAMGEGTVLAISSLPPR